MHFRRGWQATQDETYNVVGHVGRCHTANKAVVERTAIEDLAVCVDDVDEKYWKRYCFDDVLCNIVFTLCLKLRRARQK